VKALARALKDMGEPFPFPDPLPADIRKGDLVMFLAAPRVGKSNIAVDWAVKVAGGGQPVLYITTDTRASEQAVRVVANLSGETKDAIKTRLDYWSGWLTGVGYPLRWSSADITERHIMELLEAERQYWGEYPAFVVVDVAFDLLEGEEGPGTARSVFRRLHSAAQKTGAVILALHHVKGGDAADGNQFVGMSDALYRVERVPEVILTLWRQAPDTVAIHLAKNRSGQDGQTKQLRVDWSRARVGGV
jgi:KaiC/GvpD/RAD55 family RecA-like ATPase